MLVSEINFLPAVVNFNVENLQIIFVVYAEVQNITASDTAIFDFGEDDSQIVNTVKNVAKMRTIQAAKDYLQAIKDFDKAIQINPDLSEAYNNRGGAYYQLEHYNRAVEDFSNATKLNPDDISVYYNRGYTYEIL